jgi:SNF2 family DNA or RNA helicase
MTYRLICIYETRDGTAPELRIEVNKDGKSNSIAPFMRRIRLDDLFKDGIKEDKDMLSLLNHAGLQNQPFRIDNKFFSATSVRSLLRNHPWNYLQLKGKGTVKHIACPLSSTTLNQDLPTGKLLGGELYIDHLNTWKEKMSVRILYADALNSFYPMFSDLPFITSDGILLNRDKNKEIDFLHTLGMGYDQSTGTFSLSDYDTLSLEKLTKKGWKIYVLNQSKSYSQVYTHREPSGIVWFSTENQVKTDFSRQLLDGFLKSRNYHETDQVKTFFKKEDAEKADEKSIFEELGVPFNAQALYDLYAKGVSLTDSERVNIKDKLNKLLHANLRPYQMEGVIWLQKQRKNGHGCLLADEMGLGKTIQIIAHLCCLNNKAEHLVIAPTSLIYNWQNEVHSFAPQIIDRLTFVSYDMLRIHLNDYINNEYDTIVIDEAQIIKNRQTKKYQAISKLKCKHKIILTGTPIENSIDELWSHFMMLMPQLKGLYKVLQNNDVQNNSEAYVSLTSKFLKPFILRRTKQEVLSDLPEKIEKTVYIELSKKERGIYERVHAAIYQAFASGLSGRVSSIALEGLLRLRQACISANLLPKIISSSSFFTSTKLQTAIDYIEVFKSEDRQVLVFSQFVSALHEVETLLKTKNIRFVSLYGNTRSRKIPITQFQRDKSITVFLISLKAGGIGLNLTSADRVILLDDWWNPAVEDQATGRAHRIGQKKKVIVLRLICKNTVEEKILQLQDKKRNTVDLFNRAGNNISLEEIKELIE